MANMNWRDVDIQASHIAGMVAIGAILFLLCVERGFRGLKIDIG